MATTEEKIPDDVAKVAWGVLQELNFLEDGTPSYKKLDLMARAILAERERCAKLAESGKWNSRSEWSQGYDEACTDISKQIRNQD